MGTWNSEKVNRYDKWLVVCMCAWILLTFFISGSMEYNDQAGCNLPEDKRTVQQNEDCGFTN